MSDQYRSYQKRSVSLKAGPMQTPLYARTTQLMEAGVGDDLVALHVGTGNCFGFNETAAAVWRCLSEPKSFEQLRRELMSDYEVSADECSANLQELLDDLVEKRLVTIDTQEG